jgi:hypothetical protein
LPRFLLGLLAVVTLSLQGLFHPLLHLPFGEILLFQLLDLALFQTSLAQLLADLLFLLPADLLFLLPAELLLLTPNTALLLLHLADLTGNLPRFLLGLLAVVTLSLQGLFHPLLHLPFGEILLFQLLDLALFQTSLAQLLADLLFLLPAKLLFLPAALDRAKTAPLLLLHPLNIPRNFLSFPLGQLAVFAHQGLFETLLNLLLGESLLFKLLNFTLLQTRLAELLANLLFPSDTPFLSPLPAFHGAESFPLLPAFFLEPLRVTTLKLLVALLHLPYPLG